MLMEDILVMDEEEEIRRLNIPSATITWRGPHSFTEASLKAGSGLYVVVKNDRTPVYVGQTGSFKARFRGRISILRQAACDLSRRRVYLGSIELPGKWKKSRRNLRLDLESVLIRSYHKRGQKLVNRSSIREFMMGPRDAVIKNRGNLPPQMKSIITVKRNEAFELDFYGQSRQHVNPVFNEAAGFEMVDLEEAEIRRRRRPRRPKKSVGKRVGYRPRPLAGKPRVRLKRLRPRRRRPFFRRPRRLLPASAPCILPARGTELIRWVQSSLIQLLGIRLRINGVMNRATREALRDFQKSEGLPVDGIVGPETKQALIAARAGQNPAAGAATSR